MSDNIERQLTKLENESKSLKAAFQQQATLLPVYTDSIDYTTTENLMSFNYGGTPATGKDPERVIVTFATDSGANTIAKLEITTDNDYLPIVRRVPYSGGARWYVTAGSKDEDSWEATNYNFTVQSMINGTLSAVGATS